MIYFNKNTNVIQFLILKFETPSVVYFIFVPWSWCNRDAVIIWNCYIRILRFNLTKLHVPPLRRNQIIQIDFTVFIIDYFVRLRLLVLFVRWMSDDDGGWWQTFERGGGSKDLRLLNPPMSSEAISFWRNEATSNEQRATSNKNDVKKRST